MKKIKKFDRGKGFTLIELLVVSAIMGLLAVVSSQIVVSLLASQEKNSSINDIRQNGDYVVNLFERDVRAASSITGLSCSAGSCNGVQLNNSAGSISWSCVVGFQNKINRQGISLLENDIEFSDSPHCRFSPTAQIPGRPQLVTWKFELVQRRGTNNEVKVPFQTSVETRSGQ